MSIELALVGTAAVGAPMAAIASAVAQAPLSKCVVSAPEQAPAHPREAGASC